MLHEFSINYNEIIENIQFSDHRTIITYMNIEIDNRKCDEDESVNLYSTVIPCYNKQDASVEDWHIYEYVFVAVSVMKHFNCQ